MTARKVSSGVPAGLRAAGNGQAKVALDLDAFCAEAQHEPFAFTLGGHTFLLPHVGDMDWHDTRASDDKPAGPTVHELLRAALGDLYAQFADLPLTSDGYNQLQRAWFDHSGITLPELPASPS